MSPSLRRRLKITLFATLGGLTAFAALTVGFMDRYFRREHCKGPDGAVNEGCIRLNELRKKWGSPHYSEWDEETLIRDFFDDARDGFFLDVGAGDYKVDSTTYFFEVERGWRGIAIDANPRFAADYARYRPATRFFAFYVSDKTEASHPFFVSRRWGLSAGDEEYVMGWGDYEPTEVPAVTLDDLLAREQVTKIDLLSMDIEQAEPAALAGFDIRRFRPELVCIEMQPPVADRIRAYMVANDYVEVTAYSPVDHINRYYAPKNSPRVRSR